MGIEVTRARQRASAFATRFIAAALCTLLGAAPLLPDQSASERLEYSVKAAFLLNFTKFVDWPQTAFVDGEAPFHICIYGPDPFGRVLHDVVRGETAMGRRLVIRHISQPASPRTCQIVFIAGASRERIAEVAGPGVLTVGEGDRFVRDGGAIAFIVDKHRVRFDISQSAAETAGLKLSSKLLSVARSVEK
jgi:hypothetical protein